MEKYGAPLFGLVLAASAQAQLPAITGHPVFGTPKLLYGPRDFGPSNPDLARRPPQVPPGTCEWLNNWAKVTMLEQYFHNEKQQTGSCSK